MLLDLDGVIRHYWIGEKIVSLLVGVRHTVGIVRHTVEPDR